MTRFARAKGSKASNERRPEEATSWQDMRKQLETNQLLSKSKTSDVSVEEKPSWKHKVVNDSVHEQNENSVWTSFNVSDEKFTKKKKRKSDVIESSIHNRDINELTIENENKLKNPDTLKNKIKNSTDKDVKLLTSENENKIKGHTILKKKKVKHLTSVETENLCEDLTGNGNKIKDPKTLKNKKMKHIKPVGMENPCQASGLKNINKKHIDLRVDEEPSDNKSVSITTKKKKPRKNCSKNNRTEKDNNITENSKEICSSEEQNNSVTNGINIKKHKHVGDSSNSYKRRKPNPGNYTAYINGKAVDIVCYEGFFIKKEDAENLRKLKKKFTKKGIPRNELQAIMKLERRKAEKALSREKKKVCFHCRKSGHNLSECPELQGNVSSASGICFKCGSTEHTYFECKVSHGEEFRFAQCFICKEEGHIAKQCPDNPRGLYPKGGACRACGDVTHMKRDCPELKQNTEQTGVTAKVFNKGMSLDVLDEETHEVSKPTKQRNKKIKFF